MTTTSNNTFCRTEQSGKKKLCRIALIAGILLLVLPFSCRQKQSGQHSLLHGDWQFISYKGEYNEVYFSDSTYHSYNLRNKFFPPFHYTLTGDTLWTDAFAKTSGKPMKAVATVQQLKDNLIVITTPFSKDTLHKIAKGKPLISHTVSSGDTTGFHAAFRERYNNFLIQLGIIDEKEANLPPNNNR